tara:strand:+ start:814 stop:1095 length:282 start_codon:yes stop_codon:yes gene_type:complete
MLIKFNVLLLFNTAFALQQNLRNQILISQKNKCGMCKKNFSKLIPHEIHHLNHNASDNNKNNLLALCCNCHAAHHRYNISVKPYFTDINNSHP